MRIVGQWLVGDDGVKRPILKAKVQAFGGGVEPAEFLIDPGADRTVLGFNLLESLGLPASPAPGDDILMGVTGGCEFVLVRTFIELACDDGGAAIMRGEFAAFSSGSTTDLNILGRDVLNIFDVILSYQRDEVLLLRENHSYRVVTT